MADFKHIKERVSIDKVAHMLGLTLRKSGAQMRGACPNCKSGGDRALAITVERGSYYCFAERKGGDCIALTGHILGITPRDAGVHIAKHFGLDSSSTAPSPRPAQASASSRQDAQASAGMQPLDYLDPLHEAVEALGITPVTADLVGIGHAPKGTMAGRVLIPIRLPTGELIGYCGIKLHDEVQFKFPENLQDRAEGKVVPLRRKA